MKIRLVLRDNGVGMEVELMAFVELVVFIVELVVFIVELVAFVTMVPFIEIDCVVFFSRDMSNSFTKKCSASSWTGK